MADELAANDAAPGSVEAFAFADRALPAAVSLLEWCPVIDLLAMVCADEALVVNRYMKWQRVWSVHYDKLITSLAWKPDDGKVLCAGDEVGIVRLYDAETGALLFTASALSAAIASLSWTREVTSALQPSAITPSAPLSYFVPALPPPPSSEAESRSSGSFERRTAQAASSGVSKTAVLDFLTVADAKGTIVLSFIAAQISLPDLLKAHSLPAIRVARVALSSDLRQLSVVVETMDSAAAVLLLLNSSLLHTRRQELRELANQSANVNVLLSRLRAVLFPARTTWYDVMGQLRTRLDAARQLLPAMTGVASSTLEDSLFSALAAGYISGPLIEAFGQPLSEMHIKKLGKAIESALTVLLQTLLSQVLPCAELLLFRLSELLALSQCADRYSAIGFLEAPVEAALKAARRVLLRAEALLEETQQVKLCYHDLFDFLMFTSITANGSALRPEQVLSESAITRVASLLSSDINADPLGAAFDENATSLLVLFTSAEELCGTALRNPSLVISRSITLSNAIALLQAPPKGIPPMFSFRQLQKGNGVVQMLAFAQGRQPTETVRDVWVLSYTSQAAPTSSAVAHLVPEGEISSVMFYDNEHLAVLRVGEESKVSLFTIPAEGFVPLQIADPNPVTDRPMQASAVAPIKQLVLPKTLFGTLGPLAVVAPPRGLGALACDMRVLLFDFALPPDDEDEAADE